MPPAYREHPLSWSSLLPQTFDEDRYQLITLRFVQSAPADPDGRHFIITRDRLRRSTLPSIQKCVRSSNLRHLGVAVLGDVSQFLVHLATQAADRQRWPKSSSLHGSTRR